MMTVRMSPTLLARWSLRKAREPGRHSELGCRSMTCGAGIGRETACGAASGAGLSMVLSCGSAPTLARRFIILQALSVRPASRMRSEEHTSELQSLMRISYAVFCLKKKTTINKYQHHLSPRVQKRQTL